LGTILLSLTAIDVVDKQNVRNFDFFDIPQLSLWPVLGRYVRG
jgi:hypothetical protein